MARVRNAFKIRAADAPIIETSQFLQLYCPLLLEQLQHDDLFVPKLIVVRGSPGSGKSSLLRLFETDTLLAVHARRSQRSDQDLVESLTELGVLSESGPKVLGIYIQCDSSLRDIANLPATQPGLRLFNTLLDTRILVLFLRAVRQLLGHGYLTLPRDFTLEPLASAEAAPSLFSQRRSLQELEERCARIEQEFGTLLNSFPDDPLPTSIQPHARVYSLAYLGTQLQRNPSLSELMPVVMLDDVQELYPEQRQHLKDEFMRRASIPRWLAVRTHVFGLEELISVEGAEHGREYREISLDEIFRDPRVFAKFAGNVVHRRLQHTDSLQQVTLGDFKDLLRSPTDSVPSDTSYKAIEGMINRVLEVRQGSRFQAKLETVAANVSSTGSSTFDALLVLEQELIGWEREANRGQVSLFPDLDIPEVSNGKTAEAARLFLSRRLRRPYYWGFDMLASVASGNVEQLLSTSAAVVDRMIYKAELDRDKAISAKEQEESLKRSADEYYNALENKHRRGSAIKQFVDNLGRFFEEVTSRSNAPIAPGVNGFGLTRQELERAAGVGVLTREAQVFREVLTTAVAGNVLSVRLTKQGQAGSEKIVFYLNRILCVRFRLPLNYGGWQHLPVQLLVRMMQEPVTLREMTRRSSSGTQLLWDEGREK
jgi:hypothetical protein